MKETCDKLMELDKEFDRTTAELGVDGWVQYFAEDGAMVPAVGEVIRGKAAIRAAMTPSFARSGYSLRWQPEHAEASADGSMGFTYGSYVRTSLDEQGNPQQSRGRYTSIWRLQEDGDYKITMDIGN